VSDGRLLVANQGTDGCENWIFHVQKIQLSKNAFEKKNVYRYKILRAKEDFWIATLLPSYVCE
jgi:hypothetical protein